jgi:hypothetical protein
MTQQFSLAALAILRNVAFHPSGRVKLLLDKNVLSMVSGRVSAACDSDEQAVTLVLSLVWALAHNNHRAKVSIELISVNTGKFPDKYVF